MIANIYRYCTCSINEDGFTETNYYRTPNRFFITPAYPAPVNSPHLTASETTNCSQIYHTAPKRPELKVAILSGSPRKIIPQCSEIHATYAVHHNDDHTKQISIPWGVYYSISFPPNEIRKKFRNLTTSFVSVRPYVLPLSQDSQPTCGSSKQTAITILKIA